MAGKILLRDYEESDVEQIFSLMEEIYDPVVMANSRRHWRWQYHDNPRNPDGRVAIRLVERDGQVVATICGIRQEFWLRGRITPGLWVVDFMALRAGTNQSERQRFGLRLAIELRDTQPLIAGVNRPALNRYWKRILGDQVDICAVPMMIHPLRADRLARKKFRIPGAAAAAGAAGRLALPLVFRRRSRPRPDGVTLETIERFDDRFDRFWREAAPTFSHLAVRDAAYLNWRYLDIPDRDYRAQAACRGDEVVGWVVSRTLEDDGLVKGRVVDILARRDDVDIWYLLLAETVDRFREEGADLVHGLGSTTPALMEAYRDCGFRPNPEHARVSQYIAYTRLDGVDPDAFYDGDNWYVSLGDSDTDFATPF